MLFERPHLLMGWLALLKAKTKESRPSNKLNPVNILIDLYNYLRLEQHSGVPPSQQIWNNDQTLLDSASCFYKDLESYLFKKFEGWAKLEKSLRENKSSMPQNYVKDNKLWESIISAHEGHQMSLELLQLPVILGGETGYYELKVNNSLEIEMPQEFSEPNNIDELIAGLCPAPPARKNEILAWTGGTFYSRETPEAKEYVLEGQHVEKGDVIGLIEVMKMFNQIRAEFSGTIRKICVSADSGIIVSRGQQLFEIDPDEPSVSETEEDKLIRQQEYTVMIMKKIVPLS